VGVLEEVQRFRKAEVYAIAEDEIADRLLSLPDLLVKRLGPLPLREGERALTPPQDALLTMTGLSRVRFPGFRDSS